jgi:hypothetical protein
MVGIAEVLAPEFFAQDGVTRVSLSNAFAEQFFSTPVGFRNFRSVALVLHTSVSPERKDKFSCFA